jgi:hypothetical protein
MLAGPFRSIAQTRDAKSLLLPGRFSDSPNVIFIESFVRPSGL